jgi:hypothetical protein
LLHVIDASPNRRFAIASSRGPEDACIERSSAFASAPVPVPSTASISFAVAPIAPSRVIASAMPILVGE